MTPNPQNLSAQEKVLSAISNNLPEYFKITDQKIYSPKTLYNLISLGKGPEVATIRGQKYLERDSFLSWLAGSSRKRGKKSARI